MNMKPFTLTFDLGNYNHRAACRIMTASVLPASLRYAGIGFIAFCMLLPFLTWAAAKAGFPLGPIWVFGPLLLAWLALMFALRKKQMALWTAVQKSPIRAGQSEMKVDESGITLSNLAGSTRVNWPYIAGAVEAPDGILILLGGMDYLPVPASAFPDKAALDACLTVIRTQVTASQGAIA